MRTWRRCRRKWYLTHVRRLKLSRPGVTGARALGTRVHQALAAYYEPSVETFDPQRAYECLAEGHRVDIARLEAYFEARPELPPEQIDSYLTELSKDVVLAQIMMQGYFDWLEDSAADANLVVDAVEEEVEVELWPGTNLIGKLDKRVRRLDSGFTAFLDFKTVGNLTDVPKTAAQNEQGLTYSVLLRLKHPDLVVDGELIRMLRKVKRTKTAKPPFFGDHEVRWNSDQLNNYYARIHGIIREIAVVEAELAAGADHQVVAYPNPTSDCSWDCDFYPVCGMFDDGSRIDAALDAHYHAADPLARYNHLGTNDGTEGAA
jgi:hypothetical protein